MDLLDILQYSPINETFSKFISFDDAIRIYKAYQELKIIPCSIQVKDGEDRIYTLKEISSTTILAYSLIKYENAERLLLNAAEDGNTETVRILIEVGVDINAVNRFGETPLLLASKNGHTKIVSILLEYKASVNNISHSHNSALIWASQNNHIEIVQMLLKRGADPKTVNGFGYNARSLAIYFKREEIVKLLESYNV